MKLNPRPEEDVDPNVQFEFLKWLTDQVDSSVMITDVPADRPPKILHVNEAFTRLTGYQPEEVLGETPRILQGPRTEQHVLSRLRDELAQNRRFHGRTYNYRRGGDEFMMEWEIVPIGDSLGRARYYLTIQRNADKRDA